MQLIGIAIALLVIIIIIWLAVQPKQGSKASNAPDDSLNLLPNPESLSSYSTAVPQNPVQPQPVDYEMSETSLELEGTEENQDVTNTSTNIVGQVNVLMHQGRKIEAIKIVQAATKCGLKESKDYVETFPNLGPLPDCSMPSMASHPEAAAAIDIDQIWTLLEQRRKIEAIKVVRMSTGWGLRDAKDYVEQLLSPQTSMERLAQWRAEQPGNHDALEEEAFDIDRHTVNDRLRILLQQQRKIEAVKLVKAVTDWRLKDAVAYVDTYPAVTPLPVMESGPVSDRIRELLAQQLKMTAAELVQKRTGMILSEAIEYLNENFDE